MKSALKKIFTAAVIGLAFTGGALASPCESDVDYFSLPAPDIPHRALSPGEKILVSRFFVDVIDTDIIRIYSDPDRMSALGAAFNKCDVAFYGPTMQSRDYSREGAYMRGVFMHEMGHLWQHQTNWRHTKTSCLWNIYDYELTPQSRFSDFCVEQQASIIEEYVQVFLGDAEAVIDTALLQRIIEEQFPGAKELRLQKETRATPAPVL